MIFVEIALKSIDDEIKALENKIKETPPGKSFKQTQRKAAIEVLKWVKGKAEKPSETL